MADDFESRLLLLAGLAVLGVTLAVGSSAFGVGTSLAETGPNTEFTVTDEGVTLTDGTTDITAVENMTRVDGVEISGDGSQFTIDVEKTDRPLTEQKRERAKELARTNETVAAYLRSVDTYELTVTPIQKLEAESARTANVTEIDQSRSGANITVGRFELNESGDSVSVTRTPSYLDDEVSVRVSGPDGQPQYSVTVDLSESRVTDLTAWE